MNGIHQQFNQMTANVQIMTLQTSAMIIERFGQAKRFVSHHANDAKNKFNAIFVPKIIENYTFASAAEAVKTQRIARITKTALFIIATISTTLMVLTTEAAVITWPLALPAILITLIASSLFFRLKIIDSRYTENLDDQKRVDLVKAELNTLFSKTSHSTDEVIIQTFEQVNIILERPVFSKVYIKKLLEANSKRREDQSLGESTAEQNIPACISFKQEWRDQGRYGASSYQRTLNVQWSGQGGDALEISRSSVEVDGYGNPLKQPVKQPEDKNEQPKMENADSKVDDKVEAKVESKEIPKNETSPE